MRRLVSVFFCVFTVAAGLCLLVGCKEGDRKGGAGFTGTVVQANGQPVGNAVVVVDGVGLRATCDPQGRYQLGPLPAGLYNLVAVMPGYLRDTRFNLQLGKDERKAGIDFCLEPDPNYESDMLQIIEASPPAGTTLRAGTVQRFEIKAKYTLKNYSFGKIRFTAQDENDNALIRYPPGHIITRGSAVVPFVQSLAVPDRVSGKLFIAAVLLPENRTQNPIVAYVPYEVRRYQDGIEFESVTLEPTAKDSSDLRLRVTVNYQLDFLEEADLKMIAKCAYRERREVDLLREATQRLKKERSAKGQHVFEFIVRPSPDTGSVVVRVELRSATKGDLVAQAVYKPIPVPWELPDKMIILGTSEHEEKR